MRLAEEEEGQLMSLCPLFPLFPLSPHDGPSPGPLSRSVYLVDPEVETAGVTQRPALPVLPPGGGVAGLTVGADALPQHLHRGRDGSRLGLEPAGEVSVSA